METKTTRPVEPMPAMRNELQDVAREALNRSPERVRARGPKAKATEKSGGGNFWSSDATIAAKKPARQWSWSTDWPSLSNGAGVAAGQQIIH